jgi:hypothetical protein
MPVPEKLISLLQGPMFWLPATLVIYAASTTLYRRYNNAPLLNPTLLTIAGIAPLLMLSAVPYQKYFEAVAVLHYLFGTAVVALAGIFLNHLFTKTIEQMSDSQAGNTQEVMAELFRAMDTKIEDRGSANLPHWAVAFPYVNGGLFTGSSGCLRFSRIARSYLLRAAELNWKEINPARMRAVGGPRGHPRNPQ